MAKFAQYYIKFMHDAGCYEWEQRQNHLVELFDSEKSIEFSLGEGEMRKIYKHRVYHLNCAPNIIVMRFANNIDIPVEVDFEPAKAKNEPSCYVIIDNRDKLRSVAIQKRRSAFGSPSQVAKIMSQVIHKKLYNAYCYSFEILPEFYPEDLYQAWEKLQQHTAELRFGTPNMDADEVLRKVELLKTKGVEYFDDSLMQPLLSLAVEAKKANYKQRFTVLPEDKKTALWVDKSSVYIRNLVTMADALNEPVELITTEGATFRCFVDSEDINTDKIVCREFSTAQLEKLFKKHDKLGKPIEPEDRMTAEEEVVKMMNSMKHEVEDEENRVA